MLAWLLRLPRTIKRIISLLFDSVFLSFSLLMSFFLTQNGQVSHVSEILLAFLITLPLTLLLFVRLGLYRAVIRYIGQHAISAVLIGIMASAFLLNMLFLLFGVADKTNLVVVYALFALVTSGGIRPGGVARLGG